MNEKYWKDIVINWDENSGPIFYRVYADNPDELKEKLDAYFKEEKVYKLTEIYLAYQQIKNEIHLVNPFNKENIYSESDFEKYLWMFAAHRCGEDSRIAFSQSFHGQDYDNVIQNKAYEEQKEITNVKVKDKQLSSEEQKKKSIKWAAFIIFVLPIICVIVCCLFESTYNSGYTKGYDAGYSGGYLDGKKVGYEDGEYNGYNAGYEDGERDGYITGFDDAKSTNSSSSSTNRNESSGGGTLVPTSITVYITDYGSKYHRWGCQYLWDSANAISLSQAISRGYTACSKCW